MSHQQPKQNWNSPTKKLVKEEQTPKLANKVNNKNQSRDKIKNGRTLEKINDTELFFEKTKIEKKEDSNNKS